MEKLRSTRFKLIAASVPFLLLAVVIFAGTPKASMATGEPAVPSAIRFDGGSDYATYCIRCHGGDGRGQTAKGRQTHAGDLTKSRVSDTKGIRMITNGSGQMPPFKASMNADQIRGVMQYIHGFRQ